MRAVFGGFLLLALAGCAPALTEIVVVVDSDLAVPTAIDRVEIRVSNDVATTTVAVAALTGAMPAHLPATVGVRPQQDTSEALTIVAAGMLAGTDVVTAEVRTRFVSGRRIVLTIFLSSSCRGVRCLPDMTCRSGACVSDVVDPTTLPPFDGHIPGTDAGMDGAVPDAGDAARPDGGPPPDGGPLPDGGGGCTSNAECDDGRLCNGAEQCFEHACAPGTPPSCDDAIACTSDTCDPTANACAHMPLDALCTLVAGGHCDVAHGGCQYPTCDATTCVPTSGACETASCTGATCNRASSCSGGQTCCAGSCGPAGCDDGNPCTDDSCGASGCVHTNNTAPCADGDACTVADHCSGGTCTPGTPMTCDDAVACTHDACSAGMCSHAPDDALCTMTAGGTCNATMGCQYPACTPATCAPDPSTCTAASCAGGTCMRTSTCTSSQMCCGGSCTDVMTDSNNCGMCGHACTDGRMCNGSGTCACIGSTDCGYCTDTSRDSAHCGSCANNCQPNGCMSGMCVPNWDNCGTALVLAEGIMFGGNNCAATDESGAACGTSTGDIYYYSYIMTNGTYSISVTPMGPGTFVVGPLGTTCSSTVTGACGASVMVTVTTAPTYYYWLVKSIGACGEFMTGMS